MEKFDDRCVRCLAANGKFFSSETDGSKGKCVHLKQREVRTPVELAKRARDCFGAETRMSDITCASDYQEIVESDTKYQERCTSPTVLVSTLPKSAGKKGTTSFSDCKGNFHDNISTRNGAARKCKDNDDECLFACQDIVLTEREKLAKQIEGDQDVPCELWRKETKEVDGK